MIVPTADDTRQILEQGAEIVALALAPHGFEFRLLAQGHSSGGTFANGEFVRGDRRIELHFRYSLGLVEYHLGQLSLAHVDYMRALLGRSHASQYPSFSDQPMAQFEALRQDLDALCGDFIAGTGDQFRKCIEWHTNYSSLSGIQKLEFDTRQFRG